MAGGPSWKSRSSNGEANSIRLGSAIRREPHDVERESQDQPEGSEPDEERQQHRGRLTRRVAGEPAGAIEESGPPAR
jgi:hypothetical protein